MTAYGSPVAAGGGALTVELPTGLSVLQRSLRSQGQLRWRVEPLDMPENLQGRVTDPEVEPRRPSHVNGLPSGWLRGNGVRRYPHRSDGGRWLGV